MSNHTLLVFVLVISPGCHSNETTRTTDGNSVPIVSEQSRPVCLIASGDTHGWLIPCGCTSNQSGGLLRRGTYVTKKQNDADVIVVDVGGAADGTAPYQLERFRAILRGESAMNLVAHNLGAAEVAFGVAVLTELSADTTVPFLSANARQSNGNFVGKTHLLVQRSGLKLLLTGVVSPEFSTDEIAISEPADAILSVIDSVTEEYDHLVVLAYLPVDQLRQLAETLPEVDVLIGGPTGQALSPETIGRTLVTSTTNKGKFLAEVTFAVGKPSISGQVVEMSTAFVDDKTQRSNLDAFRKFLDERDFKASESGFVDDKHLQMAGIQGIAGTESCGDCHEKTNQHWATTTHSHAWQRLMEEGAHVDPYCQQCHTTGYGLANGFVSAKLSTTRTQVGCESCHGPSSAHAADSSVRTPFDAAGTCRKCHDPENSPAFEFDSYWEKVRHE